MGYGSYSTVTRSLRSSSMGYSTKSSSELFSHHIDDAMSPKNIGPRESRDSAEHPNSVPIILALDVTGSMGGIPLFLVRSGLPMMMDKIIKAGVPDPQVCFLGIGDHECDEVPLQVGQFESSDALLDNWLTKLYIEGGGGGNDGESYLLAWYFAAKYTKTDHTEKRHKKGFLFTIGDEPTLTKLPASVQKTLMGSGNYTTLTASEILAEAQKTYEVYHLHVMQGSRGLDKHVKNGWSQLLGDHVLFIQNRTDIADIIADKVAEIVKGQQPEPALMPPSRFSDLT